MDNQNTSNINENNIDFKMTGKTQPLLKEDCIKLVFMALDKCKGDLISQKMHIDESPLNKSLFLSKDDKTIMIPHEIHNEAITMYLKNNSDLSNALGYRFYNNDNNNSNTNSKPLVNSTDTESLEDYLTKKISKKDKKSNNFSKFLFIVCLILVIYCIMKKC
jgi:hypothetical protein